MSTTTNTFDKIKDAGITILNTIYKAGATAVQWLGRGVTWLSNNLASFLSTAWVAISTVATTLWQKALVLGAQGLAFAQTPVGIITLSGVGSAFFSILSVESASKNQDNAPAERHRLYAYAHAIAAVACSVVLGITLVRAGFLPA